MKICTFALVTFLLNLSLAANLPSQSIREIKLDSDTIYRGLPDQKFTHGFNLYIVESEPNWAGDSEHQIDSIIAGALRILEACNIRAVDIRMGKNPPGKRPQFIDFRDVANPLMHLRAAPPKFLPALFFYFGNQHAPPFGPSWPPAHACVDTTNGDEQAPPTPSGEHGRGCNDELANVAWISSSVLHFEASPELVVAHELGHILFNYGHTEADGLMAESGKQLTETIEPRFCEMAKANSPTVFPL